MAEEPNTPTASAPKEETPKAEETPLSPIEMGQKVLDGMKAENDRREKILAEEQRLSANNMLSGSSGGKVETKPKEETPKEYMERIDKELSEGKEDGFT